MANRYDICIEQGSNLSFQITVADATGAPLNLSGYAASGQIRYGYGCTGMLVALTVGVDSSYVSGLLNVSLTPEQTSALPVTKAVYDIEVSQGDSTFKAVKGYAEIYPEVTQ
jgi:hypothetical protein